ncbi:MAG TPA: PTS sugar transporter subunit IIA [Polyangia bacterium]|jgi:excisionase family DNA binding protein
MEERLLTVREIAEYMQMNERTILKLVNSGSLPGAKIASQWRFKRSVIDTWLADQMGASNAEEEVDLEKIPDGFAMPLSDILDGAGVLPDMHAKDRAVAIEELVACAFHNGWVTDKPWFIGAIVERESLAPTAVEGGVAFLHTRARNARKIARPFIVCGRSYHGVDFGAEDGKPTYLFFLLGLKYDRLHLPILGRLARVLRDPAIVTKLRAAPTAGRIHDLLMQEDHKFMQLQAVAAGKK